VPAQVVQNNLNQRIIDSIELLSYLVRGQRRELVENLQTHRVPANTVLLQQGKPGNSFHIIKSGECIVTQVQPSGEVVTIATLGTSGYFGERSLLMDEPCNATVAAKTDCVLMRLGMADFKDILGRNLQEIIDDEIRHREELARQAVAGASSGIKFADLELMTVLGEGSFGRVKLVRHLPTGRALALKCLRKGQLIKFKHVHHLIGEKALMVSCKHPFVIRLEAVFQSTDQVCEQKRERVGSPIARRQAPHGRGED
jgi:hypothetical protein